MAELALMSRRIRVGEGRRGGMGGLGVEQSAAQRRTTLLGVGDKDQGYGAGQQGRA